MVLVVGVGFIWKRLYRSQLNRLLQRSHYVTSQLVVLAMLAKRNLRQGDSD